MSATIASCVVLTGNRSATWGSSVAFECQVLTTVQHSNNMTTARKSARSSREPPFVVPVFQVGLLDVGCGMFRSPLSAFQHVSFSAFAPANFSFSPALPPRPGAKSDQIRPNPTLACRIGPHSLWSVVCSRFQLCSMSAFPRRISAFCFPNFCFSIAPLL